MYFSTDPEDKTSKSSLPFREQLKTLILKVVVTFSTEVYQGFSTG